jgi:hypothetical protein
MKVYYARPISLYKTAQDKRDIDLLQSLGFEILNPDKEALQERYKVEGMNVFLEAVKECDAIAFRAFPDGKLGAGVYKEILQAQEQNKPVIELPTITGGRVLSVDDTRAYLSYQGYR